MAQQRDPIHERHLEPLWSTPPAVAGALIGGIVLAAIGGVAGLVIGLRVYPPTAWFAVLELGMPAGLVGAVLGLLVGSVTKLIATRRAAAGHRPVE